MLHRSCGAKSPTRIDHSDKGCRCQNPPWGSAARLPARPSRFVSSTRAGADVVWRNSSLRQPANVCAHAIASDHRITRPNRRASSVPDRWPMAPEVGQQVEGVGIPTPPCCGLLLRSTHATGWCVCSGVAGWWLRTSRPPIHSHILDRVKSLDAVDQIDLALDVGCGAGLSTIALQRRGIADRVLGADPSSRHDL